MPTAPHPSFPSRCRAAKYQSSLHRDRQTKILRPKKTAAARGYALPRGTTAGKGRQYSRAPCLHRHRLRCCSPFLFPLYQFHTTIIAQYDHFGKFCRNLCFVYPKAVFSQSLPILHRFYIWKPTKKGPLSKRVPFFFTFTDAQNRTFFPFCSATHYAALLLCSQNTSAVS